MDDIFSYIGGVPFVQENFKPNRLIGLVAHRRYQLAQYPLEDVSEAMLPTHARHIYSHRARELGLELPLVPLSERQYASIGAAVTEIVSVMPRWAPMYEIPVEHFAIVDGRISVTCALVPQAIFLGEAAFLSRNNLVETIIHENAHLWLDFLVEIADLQEKSDLSRFDLPSGTSNKTLTGVLLAAHFAVTAHRFYARRRADEIDRVRDDYLLQYATGCLQRIAGARGLTQLGKQVWHGLWISVNDDANVP